MSSSLKWKFHVLLWRWKTRFRYALEAPFVYVNWWDVFRSRFSRQSTLLVLRDGSRFSIRPGTGDLGVVNEAAICNPYFDPGYISCHDQSVVIDVGANIGDFSVQSARLCPRGQVYAIDPIREHCERVAEHVKLNALENVQIFQLAIGGVTGDVEIHSDGSRSSTQWGSGAAILTQQVTLPEFMRINQIERIDLLKLDCEGSEWDIFPAAETVLPAIRQICLEYHNGKLNADWLAAWLSAHGYTVRRTFGQWNGLLWAWR